MSRSVKDINLRIAQIRTIFSNGRTAGEFAESLGIGEKAWSNFETGPRPGLDSAIQIVDGCDGVTLDWIYLGDRTTLGFPFLQELRRLESSPSSFGTNESKPRRGRPPSKKLSSISRA